MTEQGSGGRGSNPRTGSQFGSSKIGERLEAVHDEIARTAERAGRSPDSVRLLPVSKTVPVSGILAARAAGCQRFGENKVQEALGKARELDGHGIDWILIGHLQTNKVKDVVTFAAEVQSLDRLKLARELEKRLQRTGRPLDVLVQLNTSGETSKFGLAPERAELFFRELRAFDCLRVKGLMTLAIFSSDPDRVRACFRGLREAADRLAGAGLVDPATRTLSMGMSGDYPIAIEEGSTEVRIGQALFGPRPLPDSHYWPE